MNFFIITKSDIVISVIPNNPGIQPDREVWVSTERPIFDYVTIGGVSTRIPPADHDWTLLEVSDNINQKKKDLAAQLHGKKKSQLTGNDRNDIIAVYALEQNWIEDD
jgi:hypothetical protein